MRNNSLDSMADEKISNDTNEVTNLFRGEAVLVRLKTMEEIVITTPRMVIGRIGNWKKETIVDYSIEPNIFVSRIHAQIILKHKQFYLMDCGSVNKTYLNAQELNINQEYLLQEGDIVKFANERFLFHRIER